MAMKMIDKKDCEYKGGYIVNGNKIVCVDNEVVDLLNKLDVDVQRAQHKANSRPSFVTPADEFVPKSEHGALFPVVEAKTPELDKMTERAIKMMDEIDAIEDAAKTNEYFEGIWPVIEFVDNEFIVSGEQATQHRFDLPTIGNPLELDKESLSEWVISIFE